MIREVGLTRNNDSSTHSCGSDCCVEGHGICVFAQSGSGTDEPDYAGSRPVLRGKRSYQPIPDPISVVASIADVMGADGGGLFLAISGSCRGR